MCEVRLRFHDILITHSVYTCAHLRCRERLRLEVNDALSNRQGMKPLYLRAIVVNLQCPKFVSRFRLKLKNSTALSCMLFKLQNLFGFYYSFYLPIEQVIPCTELQSVVNHVLQCALVSIQRVILHKHM